jgi:hypothetical protein
VTRHAISGELPGEVTIIEPVRVLEISQHGTMVEVDVRLALESLHEFRLDLSECVVIVKGRIVHCELHELEPERVIYRAGIEFIETSLHVYEAIAEFIRRVEAARRDL